jgi:hypothetical protein
LENYENTFCGRKEKLLNIDVDDKYSQTVLERVEIKPGNSASRL